MVVAWPQVADMVVPGWITKSDCAACCATPPAQSRVLAGILLLCDLHGLSVTVALCGMLGGGCSLVNNFARRFVSPFFFLFALLFLAAKVD